MKVTKDTRSRLRLFLVLGITLALIRIFLCIVEPLFGGKSVNKNFMIARGSQKNCK